jgi:hypothetical protein
VERPERARRSSLMSVGAAAGVGRRSCIGGVTLRVALKVGEGVGGFEERNGSGVGRSLDENSLIFPFKLWSWICTSCS